MKKPGPNIYVQETHFKHTDADRLRVKGWGKIKHGNTNQKKDGVPISISDNVDFNSESIRKSIRHKERHDFMMCVLILQKDITM